MGFFYAPAALDSFQQPNNSGLTQTSFSGGFYYADSITPVPEPGTLALLGIGVAGTGLVRRRKGRAKSV